MFVTFEAMLRGFAGIFCQDDDLVKTHRQPIRVIFTRIELTYHPFAIRAVNPTNLASLILQMAKAMKST